jgi:hypothetical protein
MKSIVAEAQSQLDEGGEIKMWARAFSGWETDEVSTP